MFNQQGDSGGPLVCEENGQWYQMGIASWNIGCGYHGYSGVYVKVPIFVDWIDEIILSWEQRQIEHDTADEDFTPT